MAAEEPTRLDAPERQWQQRQGYPRPRRVLVAARYDEPQRARLQALFSPAETIFVRPADRPAIDRHLADADVAIVREPPHRGFLDHPGLVWVHCNRSGLEECASAEFIDSELILTSAAGRSAPVLAEHALYFMLALVYDAGVWFQAQRRRVWGVRNQQSLRGLHGRRVLIVGMGHTAKALIPRCQALGMDVEVFRRRDLGDEGFGVRVGSADAGDRIADMLPRADIVALAASLNDSSHHLLGAAEFDAIKRGALIVNVARAGLLDTAAFKAALRDGRLGGAGLDVTDPEPLPLLDELWWRRNVLVTPHVTPRIADRAAAEIDIIEHNYHSLLAGEPLRNRLGPRDLYTRGEAARDSALWQSLARVWGRLARPAAAVR